MKIIRIYPGPGYAIVDINGIAMLWIRTLDQAKIYLSKLEDK